LPAVEDGDLLAELGAGLDAGVRDFARPTDVKNSHARPRYRAPPASPILPRLPSPIDLHLAGAMISFTAVPSGGSSPLFVSIFTMGSSFIVRFDWMTVSSVTGKMPMSVSVLSAA